MKPENIKKIAPKALDKVERNRILREVDRDGNKRNIAIIVTLLYTDETNVLIEGGTPVKVPLVDGYHDLKGMLKAVSSNTHMIFICNPNNPTGTIVSECELRGFIEKVPRNVLLIIDEAYYEYVTDNDYLQTVPLLDEYPNLVVLRTFSKIYGLAALRIGYGIMHPTIVQELVKVKEPFNTNRLAVRVLFFL